MSVLLSSGHNLPLLGFGTYQTSKELCVQSVKIALSLGYRLIDTASGYDNEYWVGEAIKESNISRNELFITSKIPPWKHGNDSYDCVIKSLEDLGTDYLDLCLIHWPGVRDLEANDPENRIQRMNTWYNLERLYNEGKVKSIGVSNYTINHLNELINDENTSIIPHVLQSECHPCLTQIEIREFCNNNNIIFQAYSSLGQGNSNMLTSDIVNNIANKLNKTPAQILLRWAVQQNIPVLPKSVTPSRIEENSNIFDLNIDDDDMLLLSNMNENIHYAWDPSNIL